MYSGCNWVNATTNLAGRTIVIELLSRVFIRWYWKINKANLMKCITNRKVLVWLESIT